MDVGPLVVPHVQAAETLTDRKHRVVEVQRTTNAILLLMSPPSYESFRSGRYGLRTLTVVPVLSPSGSWLSADRYNAVGCVVSTAVKVMLPIFFGIAAFDSRHWPTPLVVHDPVGPLLQEPLTVAPMSGVWSPSWIVTVTTAVQAVC